jgi:hypothetical protein
MRILFDNGTPAPLRRHLKPHEVVLAKERGWAELANGRLISAAEAEGFELLLTTDKNMAYQQNFSGRRIAIMVLGNSNWKAARLHVDRIVATVDAVTAETYVEVEIPYL